MKDFKNYRSIIGCFLIVFIHTGINSVATVVMPELKTYYGTQLSTIITGASLCALTMFIGGFIGASFIRKVRPKKAFIFASICAFTYAFLIFITNKLWGFYLGCGAVGFTAALGSHTTSIIYINKFHKNKSGILISSLLTCGSLGSAFFQFVAGNLLLLIGLKGVYTCLMLSAVLAIIINFLLIDDIEVDENSSSKNNYDNSIFKDITFIKMAAITLFSGTLCGTFGTLCTTFLQEHGISVNASATYLSLYTLCCALLAMLAGVVADKYGYKIYGLYLFIAYGLAILVAILFDASGSTYLLPFLIILFGLASPISGMYNMLSKPIFEDKYLVASSKLLSVGSFGSAVLLPVYTKIYESNGFTFLWSLLLIISFICLILLMNILKKKNI